MKLPLHSLEFFKSFSELMYLMIIFTSSWHVPLGMKKYPSQLLTIEEFQAVILVEFKMFSCFRINPQSTNFFWKPVLSPVDPSSTLTDFHGKTFGKYFFFTCIKSDCFRDCCAPQNNFWSIKYNSCFPPTAR